MTPNGPPLSVYAKRRRQLAAGLEDGAVLFVSAAPETIYSNDVNHRYRPDTNIRYLSGFEDRAHLMLSTAGGQRQGFSLFVEARDPSREVWTGRRPGPEGARNDYAADHAGLLKDWPDALAEELKGARRFFYCDGRDPAVNSQVAETIDGLNQSRRRDGLDPLEVCSSNQPLAEMRVVKSAEEIDILRKATSLSALAHAHLMETLVPGMAEYEAEAIIDFEFRRAGSAGPAYATIAAGGNNATVLHYTRNQDILRDGQLLLVDAGAEYGGYCADITRTMPVGRSYTGAQAAVYDLVHSAQCAGIEALQPGVACDEVHRAAVRVLVVGMLDLGLLKGSVDGAIESGTYTRYFMHRTGHWLGMDVHDAGSYEQDGQPRRLEAGMVMTVEPGLYIAADADCDESLRGIGVRIEDDVLVTEGGHEVLSSAAPNRRDQVEDLRARALS